VQADRVHKTYNAVMSLIIFSHGNSFPASTYNQMTTALKKRGFTVKAIEKFGHDARYPVTNNWPHLVQQLTDFSHHEIQKTGEPAYLVGHSLGGLLSMMCAARHPDIARGVVLLDAPMIGGWRATTLGVVKRAQLVERVAPSGVSRRRKTSWDSTEAAYEFFKAKRGFALWDEASLRDYVERGTVQEGDVRSLAFSREIETNIYNTLPSNLDSLLKRKPLKCPAAFIGGLQSNEMKRAGTAMTEKLTHGRMAWLDGTHLFPMEKPAVTAAYIEAAIRNFP
jgi:pimeloyl-ACP methyl ester carboxylesterase